jgi:antitoxin YefM
MVKISATQARKRLSALVYEVNHSHSPICIKGKKSKGNAVLIGVEEWAAIEETLFLSSNSVMNESIKAGLKTPIDKVSTTLKW